MTFKQNALRAAAVLALGVALIPAHATNGYFSHGYGVKSKGMAGAGVALAQDAFAGTNNPAQSAFAGNRYDVGVDLFMPEREMSRSGSVQGNGSAESGSEYFLIPEFGYNNTINDQLSMGLTVYGNGGMNTDYKHGATNLFGSSDVGVDLVQLIIAPTLAFKLNPQHAVGVSPLIVYQTFEANGLQNFAMTVPQQPSSSPNNVSNNGKDSSTGLGVRLGYLGRLTDQLSVGASYSPKINMSRFKKYEGLFAEKGDFDIPANYTLGMAFQLTPAVQVALDYQRIEYGDVKAIANQNTQAAGTQLGNADGSGFGWSDINVIKLGVQWQANDAWTLRAGYNKGDNPVNADNVTFNILAPGVVEEHLTLGATMKLDAVSEISASYMHAFGNSVTGPSKTQTNLGGANGGTETIKMKQNSLGIQYSRKF
jgi:long-chain fatty acid transport protein